MNAMSKPVQTIGILTGGGDCPGLNAVIRAVVRAATLEHGWTVLGIPDGYDGLVFPERGRPLKAEAFPGFLPRVIVVEVMRRDAGWIGLHSGIAGGADVILIPEIPFTREQICSKIEERARAGRMFSIVVVAEGCQAQDDRSVQRTGKEP